MNFMWHVSCSFLNSMRPTLNNLSVLIIMSALLGFPPARGSELSTHLQRLVTLEWTNIQENHQVYYREFIDQRVHDLHYCEDECRCIADKMIARLVQVKRLKGKIYRLHVSKPGGVTAWTGPIKKNQVFWYFHEATLIHDNKLGDTVVDPLLFGSPEPRPFQDWIERFPPGHHIKFIVGK